MVKNVCRALPLLILGVALLMGMAGARLEAQTTTATILGTVTDQSNAAVPGAKVQVTNTGTSATQTSTTDGEGRFRVPALPIGNYEVTVESTGFQTQVRKGVVLTVGREAVVDFTLSVGQVAQTVTVEAAVAQVDTTSAAVGNLVEPTQMRELPLNGRSFEQLILLSPGVTVHQAIGYQPVNGTGNAYSVSGSRTRGQWEILDGNDVMNFQGRGSGSGVLGTQLGVDAIAEFQVLTNTYSAQFGGNGAVVNMVTRSGTNTLHGSGYEFARNQVFDARKYFDSVKPPFSKNQFGGTLGGPIKKDKMFFFFNYEGIRQDQSPLYNYLLPDEQAHYGFVPNASGVYQCVNNTSILYDPNTYTTSGCQATIPAAIQNMLKNMPLPNDPGTPIVNYVQRRNASGFLDGTISTNEQVQQPGREDYLVGRYDWYISDKNSIFARYLRDSGNQLFPFSGATWASSGVPGSSVQGASSQGRSLNQYLALGDKYIATPNVVLSTNLGYTRTLNTGYKVTGYSDYSYGQQNLWSDAGIGASAFPSGPQGTLAILPLVSPNITFPILGGGNNFRQLQNKYSIGHDVYWTKGAHGLQFGGSVQWVQTFGLTPSTPGAWTFANVTNFLKLTPNQSSAVCNAALWSACASLPTVDPIVWYRETNFSLYFQDNWRLFSNLTLNIGLRYSPQTNPKALGNLREWVNLPLSASFDPTKPMPGCTAPGYDGCSGALPAGTLPTTVVDHVYLKNPSTKNFEPRIGFAWDPFKDQKTSIRAGYGIFRSPILPYDYTTSAAASGLTSQPYATVSFSCPAGCPTFPLPPFSASGGASAPLLGGGGIDPGAKATPYMQQWNLTIQRQITKNDIISVGYVGSRGVNLIGHYDQNPEIATGAPGAIIVCAVGQTVGCNVPNGNYLMLTPGIAPQIPGACSSLTPTVSCSPMTTPGPVTSAGGQEAVDSVTGQKSYQIITYDPAKGAYSIKDNLRMDRNINFSSMRTPLFWSQYNSLQAMWSRRMANNLQYQVSYTYGTCLSNSSGTTGFENGMQVMNPYNFNQDKGNCGYLIRHALSINALYVLPFDQNELVRGWQIGVVGSVHSGSPIDIVMGWPSGIVGARGGPLPPRPNQVPGCDPNLQQIDKWFDSNCYVTPPIGEPGNTPFMSVFGPNYQNWDLSLTKNTKITERFNAQFRWEVFNILNHPNFRNPGQPMSFVFSQKTPIPASCVVDSSTCSTPLSTAGQLFDINGAPRQMQFGVKVTF
jgi:hypothetical protein